MTFADQLLDEIAQESAPIVILGIGNTLRGDEGVGIHALEKILEGHRLCDNVRAIDGGVMGLELLPYLEGCHSLLLIDAVDAGKPPGTVVRLQGEEVPAAWEQKLSMHQAGLTDLLAMLRLENLSPKNLVLLGIQPASIDWNLELSPPVKASFDELIQQIVNQLAAWNALAKD